MVNITLHFITFLFIIPKSAIRQLSKGSNIADSVYYDGTIDGVKAFNTSHVESNGFVYGDFSNLAIGTFGGLDVVVDPFTCATTNCVRIVVSLFVDSAILREEAFATGTMVTE